MSKKISLLIKFSLGFLLFLSFSYADNLLIIPKKKPQLSKEVIEERISKNIIKPKSKPKAETKVTIKKENLKPSKKPKEENKVVKKIIEKKLDLILPKSKPLIVKKELKKKQQKSKYYRQKDFNLAKKAIKLLEKRDWKGALNTSKKARDKSFYKFVQWRHLLTTPNNASFYEYQQFINNNSEYPRINRLVYLAEHKISTNKISPKKFEVFSPNWLIFGKSLFSSNLKLLANLREKTSLSFISSNTVKSLP